MSEAFTGFDDLHGLLTSYSPAGIVQSSCDLIMDNDWFRQKHRLDRIFEVPVHSQYNVAKYYMWNQRMPCAAIRFEWCLRWAFWAFTPPNHASVLRLLSSPANLPASLDVLMPVLGCLISLSVHTGYTKYKQCISVNEDIIEMVSCI